MEANELMVGDWVRIKLTQHDTKVTNIDANSVYTEAVFPIRYDEIEPIPITPEILEKNGFSVEQYSDGDYYADIMFEDQGRRVEVEYRYGVDIDVCVIDHNNTSLLSRVDTQVRYIHELQNLFRIMQINKEIVF